MAESSGSVHAAVPLPRAAPLDLAQLSALLPAISAGQEAAAQREALIHRFIQDGGCQRNTIADAAGVSHQYISKLAKRIAQPASHEESPLPTIAELVDSEWTPSDWTAFWLEAVTGQHGEAAKLEAFDYMDAEDATRVLALAASQSVTLPAAIAAQLHQLATPTMEAARDCVLDAGSVREYPCLVTSIYGLIQRLPSPSHVPVSGTTFSSPLRWSDLPAVSWV